MANLETILNMIALTCGLFAVGQVYAGAAGAKPVVLLTTTLGDIKIELDTDKAPISSKNFLEYVKAGYYDGTV